MRTLQFRPVFFAATAIAAAGLLLACQDAPDAAPRTAATEAVPLSATPTEAPATPSPVHGEERGLPTAEGAAPNDAVHSGVKRNALPSGHPAIGASGAAAAPTAAPKGPPLEPDIDLPLPLSGAGGAAELKAQLALLEAKGVDAAIRARVEVAFRHTFTAARTKRDYAKARAALVGLETQAPTKAIAHRILGYLSVDDGFDAKMALHHYKAAVAAAPEYGEAHYALAYMHLMGDRAAGKVHFDRARALGVPDTSGLAGRFGD